MLMKYELLIDLDFLDTVQITIETRKVIINTLKPVPKDKEVREMCQLGLDLNKINNIDVRRRVLNKEHQNVIKSLVDKYNRRNARN